MPASQQNTTIRLADGHPHLGTILNCGDVVSVTDVQEAIDSIVIATSTGIQAATQTSRAQNIGSQFLPGFGLDGSLYTLPIIGQSIGLKSFPRNWLWHCPIEVVHGLNKLCLTMTVRLLGEGEFREVSFSPPPPFPGGRAGRMIISLSTYTAQGVVTNQPLLEIYSDLAYFQTTYPAIPVNTGVAINWNSIPGSGFKRITLLSTLNSNMLQQGRANLARLNFQLDYIENPRGGPYTSAPFGGQIFNGYQAVMDVVPHPVTGQPLGCDGLNDFSLYLYK